MLLKMYPFKVAKEFTERAYNNISEQFPSTKLRKTENIRFSLSLI